MTTLRRFLAPLLLATVIGCTANALAPARPCDTEADLCTLRGQVAWFEIEGGFWAIRGDDQVTYEPLNLPADFRHDGVRVRATVRIRRDVGTYRMVGPVVEVLSIRRQ